MATHTHTTKSRKVVHLRLDADLHEAIVDWAARTHRTLSGALSLLIELGIPHEPSFPGYRPLDRDRVQKIADEFRPEVTATTVGEDVPVTTGLHRWRALEELRQAAARRDEEGSES